MTSNTHYQPGDKIGGRRGSKFRTRGTSMTLSGPQFQQLHRALQSAFPTIDSLRILARTALNENLASIANESNVSTCTFELIQWTESRGKLAILVENAFEANPDNSNLLSFVSQHFPGLKLSPTGAGEEADLRTNQAGEYVPPHVASSLKRVPKSLTEEEVRALRERLDIHRANLLELKRQRALHGISVPIHLHNSLRAEEAAIRELEEELGIA